MTSALTLDPHAHDEVSTHSTLSHFYNALVSFGSGMRVEPELATRWENPAETVWRFRLRRGVVFHDGRPLEAQDVVASLLRAQRSAASRVRYYLQAVESVRALDGADVEIVTRRPSPILLNKLAFIAIVPRDAPATIERPVGTGPYAFVSGAPTQTIVGQRFERFWGPRSAFDRVRIVALREPRERAQAVPSARADVVAQFPPEYWEWGRRQPSVRMVRSDSLSVSLLTFARLPAGPFGDRRVRRAVALGLDRKALAERGTHGLAAPLDQLVPPTVFGYAPGLEPARRDPGAARRLLEEAGYARGLSAPLLLPDSMRSVAAVLIEQLAAVGVRFAPEALAWPDFAERWYRGAIPTALTYPWAAGSGDASDILDDLLHSPGEGYGGSNSLGYSSPELDHLLEEADGTLEATARRELLARAMAVVRKDAPVIPLLVHFSLYALRPGIEWRPRLDERVRAIDMRPSSSATHGWGS